MTLYPLVPLKRFGRIVGGSTPSADERYWDGDVPWYTPTDVSAAHGGVLGAPARTLTDEGLRSCPAALLPAGSVVITSRAPIGNVALTDRLAATNQGCKSIVPRGGVDERFVLYAARAMLEAIQIAGTGTTFQEVSGERLGAVHFPSPPGDRQRRTADFLDVECERVDQVASYSGGRLRALFDEYRDSLIHEAVTGKLDVTRVSQRQMDERLHAASEGRLDEVTA